MLIDIVKQGIGVSGSGRDELIENYINAALIDLGLAGVINDRLDPSTVDPLIITGVILYTKANWGRGTPDNVEELRKSYELIKTRLHSATGYTDWSD